MRAIARSAAFIAAVAVAAIAGAVVQTQVNLAQLQQLGASVPTAIRLQATVHDLAAFAPVYAAVVLLAYALAFPSAALLRRRFGGSAAAWFTAAGAAAIATALLLMPALLGITPVAAARRLSGLLGLIAAGALGGWLYALLAHRRRTGATTQPGGRSGRGTAPP